MDIKTSRDLTFPVLICEVDYVSTPIQSRKELTKGSKSDIDAAYKTLKRKNRQLLDASGSMFDYFDIESGKSKKLSHWLFGYILIEPVLTNERKLDLDEFKQQVRKAVMSRARYDKECDVAQQTEMKLPYAKTFREAIESVPKVF